MFIEFYCVFSCIVCLFTLISICNVSYLLKALYSLFVLKLQLNDNQRVHCIFCVLLYDRLLVSCILCFFFSMLMGIFFGYWQCVNWLLFQLVMFQPCDIVNKFLHVCWPKGDHVCCCSGDQLHKASIFQLDRVVVCSSVQTPLTAVGLLFGCLARTFFSTSNIHQKQVQHWNLFSGKVISIKLLLLMRFPAAHI